MSFQIRDIVLYSHAGEVRRIELELGKVNIITGDSKTGKTALISIIDYCLASGESKIFRGPIRDAVSWYGLRLQVEDGQLFVARRAPNPAEKATSEIYFELGSELEIPAYAKLNSTVNFDALKQMLTRFVGIGENLHEPEVGSRPPLAANIQHSLAFAFQTQYELINPQFLFHNQSSEFVPQAIRDTLPYFLGAVSDDNLARRQELRRLTQEMRSKEARLQELDALRGSGFGKASTLVLEARNIGLMGDAPPPETFDEAVEVLRRLGRVTDDEGFSEAGNLLEPLLRENEELSRLRRRVKEQIGAVQSLAWDGRGFANEASEQVARLKSVEMFKPSNGDGNHTCPLCMNAVTEAIPSREALQISLEELSRRLSAVSTGAPRYEAAIQRLRVYDAELKTKIAGNNDKIEALRVSDERLADLRTQSTQRAHVQGRISLYLESLPTVDNSDSLKATLDDLRTKIERLRATLSDEQTTERLQSFLNQIGIKMTDWAVAQGVEHSEFPIRLDVNRLTVVADTTDGPVPMSLIGSGENWVGFHLIAHFGLHDWFTRKNRPVPRFLVLDQPSQIYFPAEQRPGAPPAKVRIGDWAPVTKMFRFIFDFVESQSGKFQVIVTEHADLQQPWFQDAIRGRWIDGEKLVPLEWLTPRDEREQKPIAEQ